MSSLPAIRYRIDSAAIVRKNFISESRRQGFRAIKHDVKLSGPETLKNLGDLGKLLDHAGIDWWLSYGALLGLIREGRFLAHDVDVDIMVAEGTDPEHVRTVMEAAGAEFLTRITSGTIVTNENYWFRDIYIDIYYAQEVDSRRVDFSRFCGCNLLMEHVRQGSKTMLFDGVELKVPVDPPSYLMRLYGPGWTTPDSGFLWYLHQRPVEIRGSILKLAYCWFRMAVLGR
jgi:hypothetical protein